MCLGFTMYSEMHKERYVKLMKRVAECKAMDDLRSLKNEFDDIKDEYSSAKVNFAFELLYQKRAELKDI